jgi:hypothetical protein
MVGKNRKKSARKTHKRAQSVEEGSTSNLASLAPRHYAQRLLRDAGGTTRLVRVNLAESPLDWLHRRGYITAEHFAAAEHLRLDFERAQLGARITMRWEECRQDKSARALPPRVTQSESQQRAHTRFHAALGAAGPGLEDILWRVVCHHEKLEMIEKSMNWPVRAGKVVLRIALERVADFYAGKKTNV